MKRIYQTCEKLITKGKWNYCRIIITPDMVDVKLSPKLNLDDEIVWVKENNKDAIRELAYSLETEYNSFL